MLLCLRFSEARHPTIMLRKPAWHASHCALVLFVMYFLMLFWGTATAQATDSTAEGKAIPPLPNTALDQATKPLQFAIQKIAGLRGKTLAIRDNLAMVTLLPLRDALLHFDDDQVNSASFARNTGYSGIDPITEPDMRFLISFVTLLQQRLPRESQ